MQDIAVTPDFIKSSLVPFYANYYQISEDMLYETIQCESGFVPSIWGDNHHSRGLVQVSDIYHPEVTDDEAFNPFYAVNYLAEGIARGQGHQWTCYRQLASAGP